MFSEASGPRLQVASIASSAIASGKPRGEGAVKALSGVAAGGTSKPPAPTVEARAPPRGGLRAWNTQLNRQSAAAQQALGFLDEMASQLQGLKGDLSPKLAARDPGVSDQLGSKLEHFNRIWRGRQAASGGSLDGRLAYSPGEPAAQRFTVRGLDLRSLRSGEREMLSFAVPVGQPPPMVVEPGLSDEALVRRLDQSLAAADIRVARGEQDALVFSTPESAWPALRDSLAVKGGGIRFPTGQFNRVRTDPEPDLLQPQSWRVDGSPALRQTLQQVLQALDAVREARTAVSSALADADRWLDAVRSPDDALWAGSLAARFEALARQSDYHAYSSIGAALIGVRRERVLALLALR